MFYSGYYLFDNRHFGLREDVNPYPGPDDVFASRMCTVCCKGPFRRLAAHQRFCKGITEKPIARGNLFSPDCGKGPYKRVDVHQRFCKKQQPLRGPTRQDAATSQSCPLNSVENDFVDESLGVRHEQPSTTLSYSIKKSMPCDPTSDPVSKIPAGELNEQAVLRDSQEPLVEPLLPLARLKRPIRQTRNGYLPTTTFLVTLRLLYSLHLTPM